MNNIGKKIFLIPTRLVPDDIIGIAAPASSFARESFCRGTNVLESMGFRTYIPDDIFKKKGYLAGSDCHRADLLNRLFADKKIKAIICARGGFGSVRMLSFLDFGAIRKNPKIFIGFSDISAILSVLHTKCGLVTFHGPVLTTLGDADQKTREAMVSAFSSGNILEIKPKNGITVKRGSASGPVSGGNLCTLCHLSGTPFESGFKGHILFLEDRGEASYKIDRMLTQMKLAGCFEGLAGLLLGSFRDCGMLDEILRIVGNIFRENDIPILAGFEAGHGMPNITIPMGLEATLDADAHLLSFHEPATSL